MSRPARERRIGPIAGVGAAPGVRLRLVSDDRTGVIERRRAECARLATCEAEWVRACGNAQARCPVGRIRFERAERRELASFGGGIVVSTGRAS